MKVQITQIVVATKKVHYNVLADDGTTLIKSDESADYSAAIPDPSTSDFAAFAGVVVADVTAKKDGIISDLQSTKTNRQNLISTMNTDISSLDTQIADMDTAIVPIA